MTNLEKLKLTGETLFGKNWQTALSKLMGISDRTMRRIVAGESPPPYTSQILIAINNLIKNANSVINEITQDTISNKELDTNTVSNIIEQYNYDNEESKKSAINAINKTNATYENIYISDLQQTAKKYSKNNK